MDFLAGAMVGVSLTAILFTLFLHGVARSTAERLGSIEETLVNKSKKETWDDADFWKRGYEDQDEV